MINHYDIAYGLGVGLAAPFWLSKPSARRKVLAAFSQRMGRVAGRDLSKPAIMIHAVSLGEINATRNLVDLLRHQRPGLHFIVSVTTETGFNRGRELYGSVNDVTLVRYPLDFSSAVDRLLDTLRPAVVILLELEVWPNFIRHCVHRGVPVLLINGRITESSFRKYKVAKPLVRAMFSRLTHVCAQEEIYADRFVELGVSASHISVTGTMKFDTAQLADSVAGQDELAAALGLNPGKERIWVCGSTGPGEEQIVLEVYRDLLKQFSDLRLVIVPRKPERFNDVADLITASAFGLIRRSNPQSATSASSPQVVLGDTIGDLRKFYSLANVVFVGRTLVDLGSRQHGSDMIEPAALAKPVVVGPFTANFAEAMNRFTEASALRVVTDPLSLARCIIQMLTDTPQAAAMATRAREVVAREQGATAKHARLILENLDLAVPK
ncbi:MAG: 3-deoxy-D-manno-octulosonic acid transferase [Planctomycetota bacterium]|nr:3-deoxy-D-manno-octulosonic acid transferase [Planctomycetota bacterium]